MIIFWRHTGLHSRTAGLVGLITAGMLAVGLGTAWAGPGESGFGGSTSLLRAQHGVLAYRTCADLNAVAARWAAQLAARRGLAHNPALAAQVAGWTAVGENVGLGPSQPVVQQALAASPKHRANLLSQTFTEVGFGTAVDASGVLYVDEVFRRPAGASCGGAVSPAGAVPSATAPAPAAAARDAKHHPAAPTERPVRDAGAATLSAEARFAAARAAAVASAAGAEAAAAVAAAARADAANAAAVEFRLMHFGPRSNADAWPTDSIGQAFGFHNTVAGPSS